MSNSLFTHDPQAVLDYQYDWSAWLPNGDSIVAHTVTVPTGLTVDSSTATSTAVTAWISGGTLGSYYDVVCHIVTADGREDDRTLQLKCEER
jgi:hypothetical protein